jgi:hypothetical protein
VAPKISDGTEVRIQVSNRLTLRVRELYPVTDNDFVSTTAGGLRQDQGVLATKSTVGIAESEFYTGVSRVKGAAPGSNLYVKNAAGTRAIVVQLEDN